MATTLLAVPGVFIQERSARVTRALPTGVPVFIGFLQTDAPVPADSAAEADQYGPVAIHRKTEFLGGARAYLGDAVEGFFDNGGDYCYVVGIKDDLTSFAAAAARLQSALALTTGLDDVDLVAVPDVQALVDAGPRDQTEPLAFQLQRAVVDHCRAVGTRIAVLDALRSKSAPEVIEGQLNALQIPAFGAINAALYHPWIRTVASDTRLVPPCGQVAGIVARTDAEGGVFRAPANAVIRDAVDVDGFTDTASLAMLTASGVNCIRAFPGRGVRVWGARTLSRDPAWTYLNVRRLVLTLQRWIDANMTWVTFEPNVPALWTRIERELTAYLTDLWRAGALQGDVARDAFFVRCDADLNPVGKREDGELTTEIGLAPTAPAEFIIVTIQHKAGTTELT